MAPTDNTLSITPESALDVATYYATCNGTNPFASPLQSAYDATNALNASLTALTESGGVCEGNPYLVACYPTVNDIYAELVAVEENVACEPLQKQWGNVFNESVCHDYYIGLYIIFYTLAGAVVLLFILMVVWSLMYQYFGTDVPATDEHIAEVMSVDSYGNALIPSTAIGSEVTDDDLKCHHSSVGSSREAFVPGRTTTSKIYYGSEEEEGESLSGDRRSLSLSKR